MRAPPRYFRTDGKNGERVQPALIVRVANIEMRAPFLNQLRDFPKHNIRYRERLTRGTAKLSRRRRAGNKHQEDVSVKIQHPTSRRSKRCHPESLFCPSCCHRAWNCRLPNGRNASNGAAPLGDDHASGVKVVQNLEALRFEFGCAERFLASFHTGSLTYDWSHDQSLATAVGEA
jgi:hypothetical protein